MCGRYQLDDDMKAIIERFDIDSVFEDANRKIGEIFPGNISPVITSDEEKKQLFAMRWGIRPSYMKSDVINARRESLFEKRFFIKAIKNSRCLIPANYFYEWEKKDSGKQKRSLSVKDDGLIAFAGLIMEFVDKNKGIILPAYAIITKAASDSIKHIHDRMPVILRKDDEDNWLLPELSSDEIDDMINRSVSEIKIA